MKILNVAEKPSISKAVANILSRGHYQTANTKNKFIKNYDFPCTYNGTPAQMTMTALV